MRILHVAQAFPPEAIAGVENYTASVARAQAVGEGNTVAVWTRSDGAKETTQNSEDGVLVVRVPFGASHDFGHRRIRWQMREAFRAFLAEWKPDVVHFQHLLYLSLDFPVLAQAAGAATLFTVHDFWLTCPVVQRVDFRGELCHRPPGRTCLPCVWNGRRAEIIPREMVLRVAETPVANKLLDLFPTTDDLTGWAEGSRHALQSVGTVLCPSQFVANNLRHYGVTHPHLLVRELGVLRPVREDKENVISEGAASSAPTMPDSDSETGTPNCGTPIVGALLAAPSETAPLRFGLIATHARKGAQVALDAFRTLAGLPVELLWYGTEDGDTDVRLPGNCRRRGRFAPGDIESVYESFDVLLVPSLWWENAPLVIREAFARGKPVIASDLGGMAESVRNGEDGLLFPVGDARALAACVRRLVEPTLLEHLRAGIVPPLYLDEHIRELDALYAETRARQVPFGR